MIAFKIKGDFKKLEKLLKKKDENFSNFLEQMAQLANSSIQKRVQGKGLGSKLTQMKDYSKPYERFRKKRGRQVSHRDLTFKGKMWQSLTTEKIGKNKVKMFFLGEQSKKALGNENRTPFFSITKVEDEAIEQGVNDYLKEI